MMHLIRAEVLKLRTTRMLYWNAAGVVVAAAATVWASVAAAGQGGLPALDSNEGVRNVLSAAGSGTLLVLVVGILVITGEFRHGTATSTFLTTPDRGGVVAAKLAAAGLVGFTFALGAAVTTLAVALPWLAMKDVDVALVSSDVALTVGGALLATVLYAVVGVGVGVLVRNQVAAIVVAVVWMMLVEGLLISLATDIGRWLPGGAAAALTRSATAEGDLLPMWAGGLLLTGYGIAFAALGHRMTIRRDVP